MVIDKKAGFGLIHLFSGAISLARRVITACCILLSFLCILSSCGTPQASLADKKNYTEDHPQFKRKFDFVTADGEKPIRYGYYYVVSQIGPTYKVRVFHPDTRVLTEEKSYSTDALTLLHGPFKSFWDDGTIRAQGHYEYGRRHGNWLECEPGKGKSSTGPYVNHRKEGIWTQLDTNGLLESVYTWHDGKRHGKFFEFDTSGQKINEGLYMSDSLIAELFKTPRIQRPYLKLCENSLLGDFYSCTDFVLTQRINEHLKYPAEAREHKIEGTALVQWDIGQDGRVSNIRVPQSLCKEIETECLRVLRDLPEWVPAQKDGRPVKFTLSLPLTFKL